MALVNYNSFKWSLFLWTPAILVPYFLTMAKVANRFDLEVVSILSRIAFMILVISLIQAL
jgi:hypothetical protein